MTHVTATDWYNANQRYLLAMIAQIHSALECHIKQSGHDSQQKDSKAYPPSEDLASARKALPGPAALDILAATFGLSNFERDILLLCAGVELDSGLADYCAKAHGNPQHRFATFGLALAALSETHWSALVPDAPLRYWRLIEVGPGDSLTASPLRIDEQILHYLIGVIHLDERLRCVVHRVEQDSELCPSHMDIVKRIVDIISGKYSPEDFPVIQLSGIDTQLKRSIAATACTQLGQDLYQIAASDLPSNAVELDALIRLWGRETLLNDSVLLLEYDDLDTPDPIRHLRSFITQVRDIFLVSARNSVSLAGRTTLCLDVKSPSASEQYALWSKALGPLAGRLNGQVAPIVSQFHLSHTAIHAASNEVLGRSEKEGEHDNPGEILWDACRVQSRPQLDDLAQRIEAASGWDDLVLPKQQKKILFEIAVHVRQQFRVYEEWGFADKITRGLGITALFHGQSGTGKTMAADVLANKLRLDLYRIDLSTVISKYIGETEKHLRQVFDAAEQGGVILLFDEADALFGKRSEVKDSHDRYANIEVSYLLQRMEAYRGLAILTTNQKSALDPAFMRRIRFVVQFPFPDTGQRAEIWKRIFPQKTPVKDLDLRKLARLNVAGGSIRNIALNAAFLAAERGTPVGMSDLKDAAQTEFTKIEKPLSTAETKDWS